MGSSMVMQRILPAEAVLVWQILTNRQHLEHWFIHLPKDFNLEVSFADPFVSTTSWKICKMVSLAIIEFATQSSETKNSKAPHNGKIVWRLNQENGVVQFTVVDQSLFSPFPFHLIERYKRGKQWHTILNKLELYIEEVSGR